MSKKKYRSEVLQSVHEAAADLRSIGAIDKATMRRFDKACLTDPSNRPRSGAFARLRI